MPNSTLTAGGPVEVASALDMATQLIAKKNDTDELLEEILLAFPTLFSGLVVGAFVLQYIKKSDLTSSVGELLDDFPVPIELFAVPVFAVLFAAAGKFGLLGAISGIVAKTSLDGWNVFANVALKGAILKY